MSRSMDTAPRDGTWVLAELDHDVARYASAPTIIVVRWDEGTEWWFEPHHAFGHPDADFVGWLPLPSGDVAHTESFYAMEPSGEVGTFTRPRSSYNKRPGIDDRDDDPVETAIEELRRALPSGDGWTRTADALPGTPWPNPSDEQVDVMMWSPGWACQLYGLWCPIGEWMVYDQINDRYETWHAPEFWRRLPALPEDGA